MTSSSDAARVWAPPAFDAGVASVAPAADGPWGVTELDQPPAAPEPEPPGERETAWREGHDHGLAEGTRELARRIAPIEAMLAPLLERLREAEHLAIAEREADVIALALAVARHLVQRELTADPTLVRDLTRRALALMPNEAPVRVRVHPEDLALLELGIGEVTTGDASHALQWDADDTLERGDFVLDSPGRIVDGRTDIALRNLYDRLTLH